MLKQTILFAFVASLAAICQASSLPKEDALSNEVDTRPVLEVEERGYSVRVPVYEDLVFTQVKRDNDIKHIEASTDKIDKLVYAIIIEKKGYFKIAGQVMSLIPTFKNFMSDAKRLAKTDTSPPIAENYGEVMSGLIKDIVSNKNSTKLSDQESYERVSIIIEAIKRLIRKSPVGLYFDWTKMKIKKIDQDDSEAESLPDFVAPVVDYMRKNGYGAAIKVMEMIGGLFKNIGKRN